MSYKERHSHLYSHGTISAGNCSLHYLRRGSGPRLAIALHGFGNDATILGFLEHRDYTVVCLDLPHHGDSALDEAALLDKAALIGMVQQLMSQQGVSEVALAGYSMGGRIALTILEMAPEIVSRIVLIAPDGLRFNYFYYFLTRTGTGRFLFRDFVKRGNWYLRQLSWIDKLRLVGKAKYKFAVQQIQSDEARTFLRKAWQATNQLIPDLQRVAGILQERQIPVHLLMGEYDKIIPLQHAQDLKNAFPA
jgi:pimeloyl-ACP methyl ester carboxylesterase